MSERLFDARALEPGDVVTVAVLMNAGTRDERWWTRFACVLEKPVWSDEDVLVLSLKMHIDPEKDVRRVRLQKDVVIKLPEDQWPQGVIAMRTKHIMLGNINLDGPSPLTDPF